MRPHYFKLHFIFSIIILPFLFATCPASAAKKTQVCDNVYALCSAAPCQNIPGMRNKVRCRCTVWKGKNIGYSSCKQRNPRKNANGKIRLTSTFGFGSQHYYANTCPSATPWAWCLDQPCVSDQSNPKRASCACILKTKTPYITFATHCDKKYCSKTIWSGAPIDKTNIAMFNQLSKSMGLKKSPVKFCSSANRSV